LIAKPVGNEPVVVKYTLLPVARACHVNVTTHGAAIVIVAVPFDTEAFFPTAILPCRSGTLNVVDQSHTQYVVQIKANNVAYVVLLIADQLHRDQPDGAVHVDHILISQVILPSGAFATGIHDTSNQMKSVKPHVKNDSTPVQSVMIALFAVNPVLVPQAMLSLVLERVLIELVFPDMRPESASSATLIDPEIDPRVNI
jgi:hypothetical protein